MSASFSDRAGRPQVACAGMSDTVNSSLLYFGDPRSVPALEGARRVPTPVGDPCTVCNDPIVDGDRGLMQVVTQHVSILTAYDVRPIHVECQALGIIGHSFGVCACTGHDIASRESALLLWGWAVNGSGSVGSA